MKTSECNWCSDYSNYLRDYKLQFSPGNRKRIWHGSITLSWEFQHYQILASGRFIVDWFSCHFYSIGPFCILHNFNTSSYDWMGLFDSLNNLVCYLLPSLRNLLRRDFYAISLLKSKSFWNCNTIWFTANWLAIKQSGVDLLLSSLKHEVAPLRALPVSLSVRSIRDSNINTRGRIFGLWRSIHLTRAYQMLGAETRSRPPH